MIRYILIVVIICAFAQSYAKPNERIINGMDAEFGEFPYMVSIQKRNLGHHCGGSIVNNRCILTAAHCFYGKDPTEFAIQYGVVNIGGWSNLIAVESATLHGGYGNTPLNGYANDVAVLKLALPIDFFGAPAAAVKLPKPQQRFDDWSTAVLTGWGTSYNGDFYMEHLQKLNVSLYPDDECQSISRFPTNRSYHICAGVPEGGKAQCSGDSGGPLTIEGVQVGIVSWSDKPCGLPRNPGVFTRVSNYVDWILDACSK